MPIYTIQGPDGKIYDVEMPAEGGAGPAPNQGTPALAAPEGQKQPFERAGLALGPVGSGVADSVLRATMGVRQLFGGLSPENRALLEEIKKEKAAEPSPGWRTTGDIAGNIAMTAVPGAKAAGGLTKAMGALGRLAPIATAGITSGVSEAIMAPTEGETYGEQMLGKAKEALKAAAAGAALTGALSPLAKMFKPTPEAVDLMEKGMTPTLQQGAASSLGKSIGALSGGAGASAVAKRQSEETVQAMLKKMLPDVDFKGLDTDHVVQALIHGREQEFSKLLGGKVYRLGKAERDEIWKAARNAMGSEPDVGKSTMRALGDTGIALRSTNPVRLSYESLKKQRDMLQSKIDEFSGPTASAKEKMVRKGLIAAKEKFDELVRDAQLNPDELTALKDLNRRNVDISRFIEAAQSPSAQKQMQVSDLMKAYAESPVTGGEKFAAGLNQMQQEILGPAHRLMGRVPTQDDTRALLVAAKRAAAPTGIALSAMSGNPAIAVPLAAGYGLSLAGQTKTGARLLFGQTTAQQKLAEILRQYGGMPFGAVMVDQE